MPGYEFDGYEDRFEATQICEVLYHCEPTVTTLLESDQKPTVMGDDNEVSLSAQRSANWSIEGSHQSVPLGLSVACSEFEIETKRHQKVDSGLSTYSRRAGSVASTAIDQVIIADKQGQF